MNAEKVATIMAQIRDYVPNNKKEELQKLLTGAPDDAQMRISALGFKSSTTALLLSIFLGEFGIDRFYLGDTVKGIIKLLTAALCGVWWFLDIFLCYKRAKKKNYDKIVKAITNE